jgi:hypothetical protein
VTPEQPPVSSFPVEPVSSKTLPLEQTSEATPQPKEVRTPVTPPQQEASASALPEPKRKVGQPRKVVFGPDIVLMDKTPKRQAVPTAPRCVSPCSALKSTPLAPVQGARSKGPTFFHGFSTE